MRMVLFFLEYLFVGTLRYVVYLPLHEGDITRRTQDLPAPFENGRKLASFANNGI